MNPSPDLRDRVLQAIQKEPSPTIPVVNRTRILAIALGFVPLAVIFTYLGGCSLGGRPLGYVVLMAVGWSLLTLAASWGALTRGRSMLGRPRAWLWVVTLVTPALLLGIAYAGYLFWPAAAASDDCGPKGHLVCLAFGSAMALGPLVAFALARRHTDPLHPAITGAAIGAAAGSWGALAIGLHCTTTEATHVALGHTMPVLVLALLGAAIGRRGVAISAETK